MVKGVDDSGERRKVVTLHGEICKTGKPSWKRGTLTFVASADTYLRKEILDHSCSSDTIPQQQVILHINKRKKIEGGGAWNQEGLCYGKLTPNWDASCSWRTKWRQRDPSGDSLLYSKKTLMEEEHQCLEFSVETRDRLCSRAKNTDT